MGHIAASYYALFCVLSNSSDSGAGKAGDYFAHAESIYQYYRRDISKITGRKTDRTAESRNAETDYAACTRRVVRNRSALFRVSAAAVGIRFVLNSLGRRVYHCISQRLSWNVSVLDITQDKFCHDRTCRR